MVVVVVAMVVVTWLSQVKVSGRVIAVLAYRLRESTWSAQSGVVGHHHGRQQHQQ